MTSGCFSGCETVSRWGHMASDKTVSVINHAIDLVTKGENNSTLWLLHGGQDPVFCFIVRWWVPPLTSNFPFCIHQIKYISGYFEPSILSSLKCFEFCRTCNLFFWPVSALWPSNLLANKGWKKWQSFYYRCQKETFITELISKPSSYRLETWWWK